MLNSRGGNNAPLVLSVYLALRPSTDSREEVEKLVQCTEKYTVGKVGEQSLVRCRE